MSGIVGANFNKDSGVVASHTFQRFTSGTSTWVKPSGIKFVYIECIGAGGGGGGGSGDVPNSYHGGGGGGGGALARMGCSVESLGKTLTITIGSTAG